MLYDTNPITWESLSEYTRGEIEKVLRMQTPTEQAFKTKLEKYKVELAKTNRLHLRNNHVGFATSTLCHYRYLCSIGVKIECVKHVILFASLTPESQAVHPFRVGLGNLLKRREDMQMERAKLENMGEKTKETSERIELLTSLIFLAKIS